MKKKLISMMLVGVMVASLLAGCGSSSDSDESGSTADSGEAIEIEFWFAGGVTAVDVVKEIIDEYNESQDQYYVTTVTQADYDETYEKLQAGIAGNAAPDLVLLDTEPARSLSDKDLVIDLREYTDDDPDFDEDDYLEVFYEQGVDDDGKLYAIPAYGTTQVMYYNREAFEEAGIDPDSIETWQDLSEAAAAIKATGDHKYGWEPMWGQDNLIDAAFSNGAQVFSEDGTEVTINSDEWVEVWEAFRTWIHDDETMGIHSGGQGWEYWYNTIDDAMDGTAGGYTGSSGDQADLDFDILGAFEQPAWDSSTSSAPMAEALNLCILEQSSDEEKAGAYDFLKYFTNPESQTKWTMATGYVAVNTKINENEEYQAYVEENPQAAVPFNQAQHCRVYPYDPTQGQVLDALKVACDKVEIDGVSAKEALDEAQETAQKALDEALGN